MALNTQTQSLALPLPLLFSSSSFLSPAYTQIKYLHLLGRLGCVLVFSVRVFCVFKSPVALMALYELFSLFIYLSYIFFSKISVSNVHQFTLAHCLFYPPLFFSSLSLLRPSRWLVFVSLSLVAAAGSGLNNEITFTVGREAARSSTQNIITIIVPTNTHAGAHRHMHKCVCAPKPNPDTCREGCLR